MQVEPVGDAFADGFVLGPPVQVLEAELQRLEGLVAHDAVERLVALAVAAGEVGGAGGIGAELGKQRRSAATTKDPYLLALATKVLLASAPKDDATRGAVQRLAAMQAQDGSFPGADHSITRSGGEALAIETTALAALALMAAGPAHAPEVRASIDWLDQHRNGFGGYGSTQSTVLALKAMAAYAKESRRPQASGTVTLAEGGDVDHDPLPARSNRLAIGRTITLQLHEP